MQRGEESCGPRSYDHDLGATGYVGIVEMHGRGLRLAVDIDFEREVDFHLPLPGVDRSLDDARQGDLLLGDAQAACGQCDVCFRVGGLLGLQDKGETLRHVGAERLRNGTKVSKK